MIVVAAIAVVLAGSYDRSTSLSCHICHNRNEVEYRVVLVMPFPWREEMTTRFSIGPPHRHRWYTYSEVEEGPWGRSHACRMLVYADGSTAPDGRH
jgi:hypothetical protein